MNTSKPLYINFRLKFNSSTTDYITSTTFMILPMCNIVLKAIRARMYTYTHRP